jgi:uncharacterized protein with HEPN domain
MSNNNQILYIISALSASQKAMYYAQNYNTPNSFFEADNQMPFNATLTLLIAIGEEVKKIDNQLLQTQPGIEWQNIKNMRNILAHDYRGIDVDIVFGVVKIKLTQLSAAFIAFLHFFPKHDVEEALQNKFYQSLQKIVFIE